MATKLPNLFLIGAMKAGTSSLHEYLRQHPRIFMTRFKEPQFFAPHKTRWGQAWGIGNEHPEPGADWYLRLFENCGDVDYAGESSVSYTAAPWVTGCEKRIYEFNPEARLIYLMRDPVERTISHYWHFVKDGREDRDLLDALRKKEDYLARSDYERQLAPYLRQFGADRVLALTTESLQREPQKTFREIFRWLGIDDRQPIDVSSRHNVSSEKLRQTRRGLVFLDTLRKHWRYRRLEKRVPLLRGRWLDRICYREVFKPEVDLRRAIEFLRPIQREQVRRLTALLGREFPEWTTLTPTLHCKQSSN
jgi:hypothetical protein